MPAPWRDPERLKWRFGNDFGESTARSAADAIRPEPVGGLELAGRRPYSAGLPKSPIWTAKRSPKPERSVSTPSPFGFSMMRPVS